VAKCFFSYKFKAASGTKLCWQKTINNVAHHRLNFLLVSIVGSSFSLQGNVCVLLIVSVSENFQAIYVPF
jgi:hypothetical protein